MTAGRNITASTLQQLMAQQTNAIFLMLLTLDHADLSEPIRVVHNTEDMTSRGNLYLAYTFDITLPPEDPETPPQVTLRIDNVDGLIIETIRSVASGVTATLEVIEASSPDLVEIGPMTFKLAKVSYDALEVTGELAHEPVLDESYPAGRYDPTNYPGLF